LGGTTLLLDALCRGLWVTPGSQARARANLGLGTGDYLGLEMNGWLEAGERDQEVQSPPLRMPYKISELDNSPSPACASGSAVVAPFSQLHLNSLVFGGQISYAILPSTGCFSPREGEMRWSGTAASISPISPTLDVYCSWSIQLPALLKSKRFAASHNNPRPDDELAMQD
jgi:hypothetical protein